MIRYRTLLTLELRHEFHDKEPVRELAFALPSSAARLMAGGRLFAKHADGTLRVMYEADSKGRALIPLPGRALQIALMLKDPHLANYTALPLLPAGGLPLFRNAASRRALRAPVSLFLDAADAVDAELMRLRPFALVELTLTAGFYKRAPQFRIEFSARRQPLKYYIVARKYSDDDFDALRVVDTRAPGADHIDFDRVTEPALGADDLSRKLLADADSRVVLFHSRGDVARRADRRAGIALELGGTALIPDLPQPGRAAASADLIVHLSKP